MATGNLKKLRKLAAALGISSLLVLGTAACDRTEDTQDPADQQEQEQEAPAPAPGVDEGVIDEDTDDDDMGDDDMDHGDTHNGNDATDNN